MRATYYLAPEKSCVKISSKTNGRNFPVKKPFNPRDYPGYDKINN